MSLGPGTSALTPTLLDPPRMPARVATVRAQFDRRAARIGAHDALLREAERRLLERLDVIRLGPRTIVDVGCGAGHGRVLLAQRYPAAQWLGVDLSARMLAAGRAPRTGPSGLLGRAGRLAARVAALLPALLLALLPAKSPPGDRVCADAGALPLPDECADLLYSNLMLHWHPQPHRVFPEWKRVLRTGGLLLFSAFGPDTLKELRAAFAAALPGARPLPWVDMHDFGDMLVGNGFATPVMDVEVLTLTYRSPRALLREVAALGGNPRDDRAPALPSSSQVRRLLAALEAQAGGDGRIALTFEIAFGHAWKPALRAAAGAPTAVTLDALRAQLPSRR